MEKVFVVIKEEYPEYRIHRVFDDKKLAEKFAEKCSDKWNEARVEEHELNPYIEALLKNLDCWWVEFDKNGNYTGITRSEYEFYNPEVQMDSDGGFYTECFAKNEKEAIKIATEKVSKYKVKSYCEKNL